ncbi:hypothetical protein LLE49_08760 [Alicyclobacillus tolerans]|uniref:hypothetical protein n=1 Tax=Alicyclobacillus tolerans TaxID=90970 RepID=UPI001F472D79|nr:hypothetical protein [Alicyclobacillus tolerans]MCF8564819.1 hypothetical protein [Alicyclobacillus tolerans]
MINRLHMTGRFAAVVVIALLMGAYGLAASGLNPSASQVPAAGKETVGTLGTAAGGTTQGTSVGDVSNQVVADIAKQLGVVGGLNDLVVLPVSGGQSYMVSATVDLADHSLSTAQWNAMVKKDVPVFFAGAFKAGSSIEDAQVYFMVNGQIVAGAGLGKSAYQALSSEVSTGQSGFDAMLSSAPMVTTQGASQRWFQVSSNPS